MTHNTKAYNELVGLLLTEEDRAKFEWVIGAMLCDAPPSTLIVHGDPGSGKSTLLHIARKILLADVRSDLTTRVSFQHEGYLGTDPLHPDTFVFAATLQQRDINDEDDGAVHISTTGERVSVNKHYVLMMQIDVEALAVSEHCINVYYSTQENNR